MCWRSWWALPGTTGAPPDITGVKLSYLIRIFCLTIHLHLFRCNVSTTSMHGKEVMTGNPEGEGDAWVRLPHCPRGDESSANLVKGNIIAHRVYDRSRKATPPIVYSCPQPIVHTNLKILCHQNICQEFNYLRPLATLDPLFSPAKWGEENNN